METPIRHLIHVGYAKAGATFFKAWCASRDDVAFTPGGVAGLRRIEDVREAVSVDVPPRLLVTSSESLVGGAGVRTGAGGGDRVEGRPQDRGADVESRISADVEARQSKVCGRLADLFPTAHILILVRGYRGIVRSMVSQGVKMGNVPAEVLAIRPSGGPRRLWFGAVLDYDRVVGLYEQAFGADRVTVLPYELLRDDPEAYVAALCAAGGVPPRPFDPGRLNVSPSPHALGLMLRTSRAVSQLPGRGASRAYRRLLGRSRQRPSFDRLGKLLGVAPFPERVLPEEVLRVTVGGQADALARRPEVAPFANEYLLTEG